MCLISAVLAGKGALLQSASFAALCFTPTHQTTALSALRRWKRSPRHPGQQRCRRGTQGRTSAVCPSADTELRAPPCCGMQRRAERCKCLLSIPWDPGRYKHTFPCQKHSL